MNQLKESQKKEQRALKDLTMTKNNTMIAHKKMEAKMKLEKKRKWTQDILLSSQTHNQNQNNNSEKVQMTFHSIGLQASFPDVHTFTTPLTLQEKLQRVNNIKHHSLFLNMNKIFRKIPISFQILLVVLVLFISVYSYIFKIMIQN